MAYNSPFPEESLTWPGKQNTYACTSFIDNVLINDVITMRKIILIKFIKDNTIK